MNIARLVLDYFRVLAWPLLVTGVVIGYRKPLSRILAALKERMPHLRKLTAPGGFGLEWEEITKEFDTATGGRGPTGVAVEKSLDSNVESLIRSSPRAALLDTFAELERVVRQYHGLAVRSPDRQSSMAAMSRDLVTAGLISADDANVIAVLSKARNEAAHGRTGSAERTDLAAMARQAAITKAGIQDRLTLYGDRSADGS